MFLLGFALMCTIGTTVESAINQTSCDQMSNNRSCEQDVWRSNDLSSMYCGLTTLYDNCKQLCYDSRCDAIECRSSVKCDQTCYESHACGSLTCDSKKCDQYCYPGVCSSMKCAETVEICKQTTARTMICEAKACQQTCDRLYGPYGVRQCRMTCPAGGKTCSQFGLFQSNASMECERDACEQQCGIGGGCNMTCSSAGSISGSCQQQCSSGTCESMVCSASNCTQNCLYGQCSMLCPLGVKTCTQTAHIVGKTVVMQCYGEVCSQNCSRGNCDMTCSPSVKQCYQTCEEGSSCLHKCDAETCMVADCSRPSSCAKVTNNSVTAITNPPSSSRSTAAHTTGHPSAGASRRMRSTLLEGLSIILALLIYLENH